MKNQIFVTILSLFCVILLAACGSKNNATTVVRTPTTTDDTTSPSTPENLITTAESSNQINLTWLASSDDIETTGYDIFRNNSYLMSTSSNSAIDKELMASTNYCYSIAAFDAAGNYSNQSTQVCEFTQASAVSPPSSPDNFTVSNVTSSAATIFWDDNSNNETGYEIGTCSGLVVSVSSGYTYCPATSFVATLSIPANSSFYNFINLTDSTTYYWYIRAINAAGESTAIQVKFTTLNVSPVSQEITLYVVNDSLVLDSSSNSAIAGTSYSQAENSVGCNWSYSSLTGISNYVCAASLMYFDISSVAGKTITSASLNLSVDILPANYSTDYKIWAIFDNWNNTVNWNTIPRIYASSGIIFNQPTTTAIQHAIDVTSIVTSWADGSWNNYGFLLEDAYYTNPLSNILQSSSYCSREYCGGGQSFYPQLVITYE